MLEKLEGKKTYITAVVTGAVAAAQVLGYEIPVYVLTILAALGLYSVRSAIKTPQ
jgi:hypothetical protein